MKIDHLIEHKKGVKAVKYAKKPVPVVGPEALKKKAKAKAAPPKTELEKHSKLATKLEGVSEGSAQEKLYKRHQELRKKSGLPDPEYYKELKSTYDLPDEERHTKTKELKNKYNIKEGRKKPDYNFDIEDIKKLELIKDMPTLKAQAMGLISRPSAKPMKPEKVAWFDAALDRMDNRIQIIKLMYDLLLSGEGHQVIGTKWSTDPNSYRRRFGEDMQEAKEPETTKPRNFVAKNAKTAGAGKHKDAKKAMKDVRGQKHKNKEMAETYDQARAARIRYALMLKENDWDIQSDEMIPPEYDMDPAELKAIRNAEFTEQDKIQAMIKLAAGGTSDEDIAKIYDMDKETVASILDDYVEEIEAETDQDADVKEAEMGKVVDYKPGVSATIDTGPGMTTMLDLKKNPTSLTKDPATGKLKLMPGTAATAQPSATTQSTVKSGDQVEIPKTTTPTEDLKRLAGLK